MRLLRKVTVGNIALAWAVLLFAAALILPNLGAASTLCSLPAVKTMIAAYWALLLVGTPVALVSYFRRAWRGSDTSSNRVAYIAWLSLETVAAAAFVAFLMYTTIAALLAMP